MYFLRFIYVGPSGRNVRTFRYARSWVRSPGSQRDFFLSVASGLWCKLAVNYENGPTTLVTTLVMITKRTVFETPTCKRISFCSMLSLNVRRCKSFYTYLIRTYKWKAKFLHFNETLTVLPSKQMFSSNLYTTIDTRGYIKNFQGGRKDGTQQVPQWNCLHSKWRSFTGLNCFQVVISWSHYTFV